MIKTLIENYKELTVVGVFAIAIVWYLWHQTRAQTEREKKHDEQQLKREEKHDKIQEDDRKFHRGLITNHLKGVHEMSLKNTELNIQGIALQKEMIKDLKDHNGDSQKAWRKINESLSAVCDKLNDKKVKKKNGQKK